MFTHIFWHRKNRNWENCTHRLHKRKYTPIFLHAKTLPRTVFTQQQLFRTETFTDSFFSNAQHLLQTDGFYMFLHRKFSAQKVLCITIFYIQTLLYTDAFTRKTNCTHKFVHTAHFYTQPTFTRRGFASPSWSPTFRVPPLKSTFVMVWLAGSLFAQPFCCHGRTQWSLRWNAQVKRLQIQSKTGRAKETSERRCGSLVRCDPVGWSKMIKNDQSISPGLHQAATPEAEHLRELAAEEAEAALMLPQFWGQFTQFIQLFL